MATLYRYFKDLWKLAVVALVLAAINQIFSLLDPLIFRHIIDSYATRYREYSSPQFVRGVGLLLAAAVGVALVSRIAKNFQDYFVNVITQKVGARIYTDGVRHSLDLPYTLFEDQRSGETLGKLQRVRSDVEKFVALLVNRRVKTVQKRIVTETTALAGATTESLRNIELVKSLGLAQQEIDRLNSTTDKILKLELEKVRYLRSLSFVQGSFVNLLRTSILLLMLYLIYTQRITVGQFFSLFIYSFFIFGPLQELGNVVNAYRETEASLENFEEILKMPMEQKPEHPVALPSLETLEFDRVSFQHQSASSPALSEVSFRVARGETIAFVGPSGAGKTSLVKLLVGLYRPKSGHIFYNGTPEDQVAIEDLRERIGFVTQDTQLFSGSIRENLQFVRPDATDEECLELLGQAAVEGLLLRANDGLDSKIGEGGVKVSGGEKQRLSIARALLRRPQLLVFDEATSSLDSLTEEEISETIREVAASRDAITILIAHRLSTVLHADCIYVLERGRIVEFGPHEQLLDHKGLYYAMWRQQVGEARGVAGRVG